MARWPGLVLAMAAPARLKPGGPHAVDGVRGMECVVAVRSVDNADRRIDGPTATYRFEPEVGRPVSCESRFDGGAA